MSREQFEEWAESQHFAVDTFAGGAYCGALARGAWAAWRTRQPEIDALKADNKHLSDNLDSIGRESITLEEENSFLEGEIEKLKAEVERLREDAERLDWLEAHPRIGEIHVDGEVKDCYLYAVSGALGVPLRAIIDAMRETK